MFFENKKGFIALTSILIISAVGFLLVSSLAAFSISSSKITSSKEHSMDAVFIINGCVEDALLRIRDENFLGTNNLLFEKGSCDYNIVSTGAEGRVVEIESEVGLVKKRSKIIIDEINPKISISSWEEVVDY